MDFSSFIYGGLTVLVFLFLKNVLAHIRKVKTTSLGQLPFATPENPSSDRKQFSLPNHAPNYIESIIIGAGPAGLTLSGRMKMNGMNHIVIEASEAAANSWANHYKRLHLHTHRDLSHLPGLPFPSHWPAYVGRENVVSYLRGYATMMQLPILYRHRVLECQPVEEATSAHPKGARWKITLVSQVSGKESVSYCRNLLMCTGENSTPRAVSFDGLDSFPGPVIHSHDYDVAQPFAGKRVLVVGFGNSGGEILIDLHEHQAKPDVVVRGPCNVMPRDAFLYTIPLMPWVRLLPARLIDTINKPGLRSQVGDLTPYGIRCPHPLYGPVECIQKAHRPPVIDIGQVALIKNGDVKVRPVIKQVSKSVVTFQDGSSDEYDAIILATGFLDNLNQLLPENIAAIIRDENGKLFCSGGKVPGVKGLYFSGFSDKLGRLWHMQFESQNIIQCIQEDEMN